MLIIRQLQSLLSSDLDDRKRSVLMSLLDVRSFSDVERSYYAGKYAAYDELLSLVQECVDKMIKEEEEA